MSNFNFFTAPKSVQPAGNKTSIFSMATPKVEEKKEEDPKVETNTTEVLEVAQTEVSSEEVVVEQKTEEVKEEVPQENKKRTRKSKVEDSAEYVELQEEKPVTYINAKFEPSKIKLSAIQKSFSITLEDEEWETKKEELSNRVDNIKISEDINLGSVRILLAQCTNLYSDLKKEQRASKVFYNVMLDKTIGLIHRQKGLNSVGTNAAERDRNGFKSCEQFKMKTDRGEFNLYDITMILQDRIETINDLIDDVKQKKESLYSYLAILKLEAMSK